MNAASLNLSAKAHNAKVAAILAMVVINVNPVNRIVAILPLFLPHNCAQSKVLMDARFWFRVMKSSQQ